jgi:hypothetical protein
VIIDNAHNELLTVSPKAGGANVAGVLSFPRNASGNVAPSRILAGANTQFGNFMAFLSYDPINDEIYTQAGSGLGYGVFPRTANGNVAPSRLVLGAATGFQGGEGIVYDPVTQRMIVADSPGSGTSSLRIFRRTDNGNVAPQLVVAGPSTLLVGELRGVAVDAAGGFTATTAPTGVAEVPAMSTRALLILALLTAAFGAWAGSRRRRPR